MRRREVLGLCGTLAAATLAGCSGNGASRSCPTRRVTPVPYPDPPTPLTAESVVPYLADVERAYQTREHDDGKTVDVSLGVTESSVEAASEGFLATLEIELSTQDCRDGTVGTGGGSYSVRYYANETTVVRSDPEADRGEAGTPTDPRERGVQLVG